MAGLATIPIPPKRIAYLLDRACQEGQMLFLVDAMDNVPDEGGTYPAFVSKMTRACRRNRLVFVGRPTVGGWIAQETRLDLLRLTPWDAARQHSYFGIHHGRAVDLCQKDAKLLGTPMLAYSLRSLLRAGKGTTVQSRWDLFRQFIDYTLYRHLPTFRGKENSPWSHQLERALGQLAYEALHRRKPYQTVVPMEVLTSLSSKCRSVIKDIPASGITDLLQVEPDTFRPSYVFTHQSYQEFLAAKWVAHSEKRTGRVLREYWNPKWREVIKFLAGCMGEPIVEGLLQPAQAWDPLHARLFLAAECAGQTHLRPSLERFLVRELRDKVGDPGFADRALAGLVAIGSEVSHDTAWSLIRGRDGVRSVCTAGRAREVLRPLYTPHRLRWVLEHQIEYDLLRPGMIWGAPPVLSDEQYTSGLECAELVLKSLVVWAEHMSADEALRVVVCRLRHMLSSAFDPILLRDLLVRVLAGLGERPFGWLMRRLLGNDGVDRSIALSIVSGAVVFGARLGPEDLSHFMDYRPIAGRDRSMLECIAGAVDYHAGRLTREQIGRVFREWWNGEAPCREILIRHAARTCSRLPSSCIDFLVGALGDATNEFHGLSGRALLHCRHRFSDVQAKAIVDYMRREPLRPGIAMSVLPLIDEVEPSLAAEILDWVGHPDRHFRLTGMACVEELLDFVKDRHIKLVGRNLRRAQRAVRTLDEDGSLWPKRGGRPWLREAEVAVNFLAKVGDRAPESSIRWVIELVGRGSLHVQQAVLRRLAAGVQSDHVPALVDRACECTPGRSHLSMFCAMIPAELVSGDDARRLALLLEAEEYWPLERRSLLELLTAIHEQGGLTDLDRE